LTGPQGLAGPQGPKGDTGSQGPAGNPNIFPSSSTYTLSGIGTAAVVDAHVTPGSVIVIQYVSSKDPAHAMVLPPVVFNQTAGSFSVRGQPGAQFRYVVYA
jgi:hypothetical protein